MRLVNIPVFVKNKTLTLYFYWTTLYNPVFYSNVDAPWVNHLWYCMHWTSLLSYPPDQVLVLCTVLHFVTVSTFIFSTIPFLECVLSWDIFTIPQTAVVLSIRIRPRGMTFSRHPHLWTVRVLNGHVQCDLQTKKCSSSDAETSTNR